MEITKTKLTKILLITLYISTIILFEINILFDSNINPDRTLNVLAFFSVIQLITSILIISIDENKLLSFRNMFLIMSFIFHLGHLVLLWFGYNTVAGYDMRGYTNDFYYNNAMIFSIRVHYFLFLGMLLGYGKLGRVISKTEREMGYCEDEKEKVELTAIFHTGIVLLLVGLIPRLYIDLSKSLLYFQGNYSTTRTLVFSGILVILARMANTGIILMMIGKYKSKTFTKVLMFFALTYNILYMITGSRGESVITIVILLFVYFSLVEKIRLKSFILISVFSYIFLSLLAFIADTRHIVDRDVYMMFEILLSTFTEESPLISVIAELGVSIKTVFYSIEFFPSYHEYSYGVNYLKSIFMVFPNFGGIIHDLVIDLTYIYYFPEYQVMGGSYIGEMYYAAGKLAILIALLIGITIGKLSKMHQSAMIQKKWLMYAITIVIFSSMLWWIRDYFYVMVREIVWISAFIVMIYSIAKTNIKKRHNTNRCQN